MKSRGSQYSLMVFLPQSVDSFSWHCNRHSSTSKIQSQILKTKFRSVGFPIGDITVYSNLKRLKQQCASGWHIYINRLSQREYRYHSVQINLNVFETAFLNINYTHPDLFLFFPGSCLFYPFSPCVLFCPLSCGGHLNKIRAKFGSVTFLLSKLLCKRRHTIK